MIQEPIFPVSNANAAFEGGDDGRGCGDFILGSNRPNGTGERAKEWADVIERSCVVARGINTSNYRWPRIINIGDQSLQYILFRCRCDIDV
jgi:hypothetical protein